MIETSRVMPARPERVFAVLADGWSYAGWVVGNAHIRDVDESWPAEGSRIHHKAGAWPLQVPDISRVTAVEPGRMIELEARLWVLGRARVRVVLEPEGDERTKVTISEEAIEGPARLLPVPVQALYLKPRNSEALSRLEDVVVHRGPRRDGPGETPRSGGGRV
ncbi:SRPBCC family protein [Saccharomonospora azurea]|uniref:SRPBCC family protein n=1 Tax=Saccharomonospora azurea TaxID=40988 RepID=UPI003D92DAD8